MKYKTFCFEIILSKCL